MENNDDKIFNLILKIALVISIGLNIWLIQKIGLSKNELVLDQGTASITKIEEVSAKEIYPLFFCPCCGQPLDKNNICCGLAEERINYIDGLVKTEASEEDVIFAYVKKYGLNSFVDEERQEKFRQKLVEEAPADRPIISLSPESYDFGDISQKEGITATFFELANKGKSDLVIDRIETSCGCTSAAIVYQEEEGPRFAMPGHGIDEEIGDWQISLAPGETAQLKVYYDPNAHPDFRGAAIREVYIFSNDSIDFEKKVSIELNQVD